MIRNNLKLKKFYQRLIKKEKLSHKRALRIYEALHKEALFLGAINSENILDGLEVDLRISKIMNGLAK